MPMNPEQDGHTDRSFESVWLSLLKANPHGNSVAAGMQERSGHKVSLLEFIAGNMLIAVQECKRGV